MAGQLQQLDGEAYIVYTGISAEYGTGFSLVIEMQMQKCTSGTKQCAQV